VDRQKRIKIAQKIVNLYEKEMEDDSNTYNLDLCSILDIVATSLIGKQYKLELFLNRRELK